MTKRTQKIIVNFLTISRIIGAFFLPFIFVNTDVVSLFVLLAVLFLTDFLDGKLSRRWKVQTVGGMLLDPLADKVLAISCIGALIFNHSYLWVLLVLECAICIINLFRMIKGEVVTSNFIGKFKTWILSITLVLGAINLYNADFVNFLVELCGIDTDIFTVTDELVFIMTMLTTGCELVTFASYIKEGLDNKRARRTPAKKLKKIEEIVMRLFDEEMFSEDKNRPLREIIREK